MVAMMSRMVSENGRGVDASEKPIENHSKGLNTPTPVHVLQIPGSLLQRHVGWSSKKLLPTTDFQRGPAHRGAVFQRGRNAFFSRLSDEFGEATADAPPDSQGCFLA